MLAQLFWLVLSWISIEIQGAAKSWGRNCIHPDVPSSWPWDSFRVRSCDLSDNYRGSGWSSRRGASCVSHLRRCRCRSIRYSNLHWWCNPTGKAFPWLPRSHCTWCLTWVGEIPYLRDRLWSSCSSWFCVPRTQPLWEWGTRVALIKILMSQKLHLALQTTLKSVED